MATSGKVRKATKLSQQAPSLENTPGPVPPPEWLTRTAVYKRVPVSVRYRLDQAILMRPGELVTLERIAGEFDLTRRYRVSLASLKSYAHRLEQFVRPAVTSHLMAGVLGCLPPAYREQLLAGSRVLLVSRVIKALTDELPGDSESKTSPNPGASPLSVADLAKLAAILSAVAGKGGATVPGRRHKLSDDSGSEPDERPPSDPAELAETVRAVYGLNWPAPGPR